MSINDIDSGRFFSPRELAAKNGGPLPLSQAFIYECIRTGKIPSVTVGGKKLIPAWFVKQLYEQSVTAV